MKRLVNVVVSLAHGLGVLASALVLTLALFLVLPLMQAIARPPEPDLDVRSVDVADVPPPPAPEEPEPEPEPEEEPEPPKLEEEAPPLDLEQLELALGDGVSEGWLGGDFAVSLDAVTGGSKDVDALFSLADLDQKPRVIYQPAPELTAALRKRAPGRVVLIFVVDEDGRVDSPIVQSSTDPVFERAALTAIKRWKFEPGQRAGKPVRFRMRIPITFPKEG